MTYQEIIKAWNDEADKFTQECSLYWDELGEDKKVEFAFNLGVKLSKVVWSK